MQKTAPALAVSAVAQSGLAVGANGISTSVNQLVVTDWRLRQFSKTVLGSSWSTPTTNYLIVSSASGDVIKKSGVQWDLGYQDLGVNTPVTLPDASTGTCVVSSVAISANEDLICWYSNKPLNGYDAGVHVQRVYDDGDGHLYWGDPYPVSENIAVDDLNSQSQNFFTFPRIQSINGEYWITALHCSRQANTITYHMAYARGKTGQDGEIHFSAFEYLVGVSSDLDEAGVGINGYDNSGTPTSFVLSDIKNAYLEVSGNYLYIIGMTNHFRCDATVLVGVDNPSKKYDLTVDNPSRNIPLPTAPTAGQGGYRIINPDGKYNSMMDYPNGIIVPGAFITQKCGYGNNLVTVTTEYVDEISPTSELQSAKNEFQITTSDQAFLRDWTADVAYEYNSAKQATYDVICDLTGLTEVTGSSNFSIGVDQILYANPLGANAPTPSSVAYIHQKRSINGSLEFKWKISNDFSDHHVAAVFQGTPDGVNYWAVMYNGDTQKFELVQAVTDTKQYQYVTYNTPVAQSGVVSLATGTSYWMKVTQYHNHIIAHHSTDRITWTKEIEYTGTTANLGFWGIAGKSTALLSSPLGITQGYGAGQALDNSGSPAYVAIRIQTGALPSTLYALTCIAAQAGNPADLVLGIALDNGSGTAPADLTDTDNIVWQGDITSSEIGSSTYPTPRAIGPETETPLTASTYYWVFMTFKSALGVGQNWYYYSIDPDNNTYGAGLTMTSSDGTTWTTTSDANLGLVASAFVMYDYGRANFESLYWSSGERPKTIEYLVSEIAAKASVLSATVDSFLTDTDLTLEADNIYWQPESFGTLGDFYFQSDVTITDTATMIFRSTSTGSGVGDGFWVELDQATQKILMYEPSSTLFFSADSMQYIPAGDCHLELACWKGFVYVYINRCLAAIGYSYNMNQVGYFGLKDDAVWTNSRIPDMTPIKTYFSIDADQSSNTAMSNLLAKPLRYVWYMNYDGSVMAGSFPRRTSEASYQTTIRNAGGAVTGRWSINESVPQGNYYAIRYSAYDLDASGRRHVKKQDYTDAETNELAYQDGKLVLRNAEERADTYNITLKPMDWSLQREDRITVTNSLDGTSGDYIVNDIQAQVAINPANSEGKIGLRKFVE